MSRPWLATAPAVMLALMSCAGDRRRDEPSTPPAERALAELADLTEPDSAPPPPAAVGPLDDVAQIDRTLFSAAAARPLGRARAGDWLAENAEYGQTVADWWKRRPNLPTAERRTLYLLPLGHLFPESSPPIETLRRYIEIYFGLPAVVLPEVAVAEVKAHTRINPYSKNLQMNSVDVLTWMKKKVPADAYAVMAITETDLYPEDSWNFVFGQASFTDRVAVQSTARYHPSFYGQSASPLEARRMILRRTLMVVSHELGHAFGISHCTWYACAMNGSNHLEEADRRPLHVCPVDLRKLHRAAGFDVRERYEQLEAFYRELDFDDEADWIDDQLERGIDINPDP
ncbi:MAG TPA: archaemetzincin [Kofleriaceae bacterium]|nr:archaemetzincin [Kofleriaceae bacterium]